MGDAEKGKILYKRICASCHTIEKGGKHKIGPNLFGIYGKTCGTTPGYKYSQTMQTNGLVWNDEALHGFLKWPARFMPGNRMTSYSGIKREEDREDIIAYLKTLK